MNMKKLLLMGNEAIALGAIRAGVSVVTGYPGTPSTEILETVAKQKNEHIYVEWSVNEKSALETAAGAACAGVRALVTMKQVGLNVASDPLMSLNYIGVAGGLVVVTADDPGPISSQTEQDTRHFGLYAKIAVFDPSSPEEAYTMTADAFEYSEKFGRPVILRPTTRICHSYASVEIMEDLPRRNSGGFEKSGGRWVIFPNLAYRNHIRIEEDLVKMGADFSSYQGNRLSGSGVKGIAAGGVSYAYVMEALASLGAFPEKALSPKEAASGPAALHPSPPGAGEIPATYKLLKAATIPFPSELGLEFLKGLKEVLVFEELDPVIERELIHLCGLYHLPVRIRGKLSGDLPKAGELKLSSVMQGLSPFLGLPVSAETDVSAGALPLPARPPILCAGCPHRGSFFAVKEAVRLKGRGRKVVYSGDIGCYTLGNAMPLDMVDTCLCMGAGITMAQGINRAEPDTLNFAFIGDSTFFHTGIPGLINAVYNRANIVVVILDNYTTAMTGNQPHPGMGKNALGQAVEKIDIFEIVRAAGVKEIIRANPFEIKASVKALEPLLDKKGVRVVLFEGPCIAVHKGEFRYAVIPEKCTACKICVNKLGCPALVLETRLKVEIDPVLCTGCGICAELCPSGAFIRLEAAGGGS